MEFYVLFISGEPCVCLNPKCINTFLDNHCINKNKELLNEFKKELSRHHNLYSSDYKEFPVYRDNNEYCSEEDFDDRYDNEYYDEYGSLRKGKMKCYVIKNNNCIEFIGNINKNGSIDTLNLTLYYFKMKHDTVDLFCKDIDIIFGFEKLDLIKSGRKVNGYVRFYDNKSFVFNNEIFDDTIFKKCSGYLKSNNKLIKSNIELKIKRKINRESEHEAYFEHIKLLNCILNNAHPTWSKDYNNDMISTIKDSNSSCDSESILGTSDYNYRFGAEVNFLSLSKNDKVCQIRYQSRANNFYFPQSEIYIFKLKIPKKNNVKLSDILKCHTDVIIYT